MFVCIVGVVEIFSELLAKGASNESKLLATSYGSTIASNRNTL
jgi:hypothetical protein